MNNASINLHGYCNNYILLYNFARTEMDEFWTWLAKMWYIFYYKNIDERVKMHSFLRIKFRCASYVS